MQRALEEAFYAEEMDEVPVGAVIQLADGRCFAAHNAPISRCDATAHAEILALRAAMSACSNYRLTGATMAVTLEPCLMCCGAMIHARIAQLIVGATDTKTGAVTSRYQTMNDPRLNHQIQVSMGVMKNDCSQLLRNFFRQRRQSKPSGVQLHS